MRPPYPSDLSDAEWAILQPLLPPPRCDVRPRKYDLREIVNAIRYLQRTGCSWRMLPHDFPPYQAVFYAFHVWRRSGVWEQMHAALHQQVRQQAGRQPQPSVAVADSQSVKTTEKGVKGYDWHKRIKGRKRHVLVDTFGWLLAVQVTGADRFDNQQLPPLVQAGLKRSVRLRHVWVDGGYRHSLMALRLYHQHGVTIEVVPKPKAGQGWQLLPRRWVVERTFAWLGRFRRMSKDYEYLPQTSEAMIYGIMTTIMLRRLAHAPF